MDSPEVWGEVGREDPKELGITTGTPSGPPRAARGGGQAAPGVGQGRGAETKARQWQRAGRGPGQRPTLAGPAISLQLVAGGAAAVEATQGVATLALTAPIASGTLVHVCEGGDTSEPGVGPGEAQDSHDTG